jgi:hypothetical protein
MDTITDRHEFFGSSTFPDTQTELRWLDSDFWTVRRPYPIEIPCPACGAYVRCDFFGRQRCPHGHLFGQRAFWSGRASFCCLLLEDIRARRVTIIPEAPLRWRDDGRLVVGDPRFEPAPPPATEAPL